MNILLIIRNVHIRNVSVHFIFNILTSFIPFLALPILTRYLTPEDYGIFTIYMMMNMLFNNIFRLEINTALKKEYVEKPNNFSIYISSAFIYSIVMLCCCVLFSLIALLFLEKIYYIPTYWIPIIVITVFFKFSSICLHHLWLIQNKSVYYGIWSLSATICSYLFCFAFIYYYKSDWQARAYGEVLVALFTFPIALYFLRRHYSLNWRFDFGALKKLLGLSLPLVPSVLVIFYFSISDRLFLAEFSNAHDLGLYAIAIQLAAVMNLFFAAIRRVWEAWIFNHFKSINQTSFRKILKNLVLMILGVFILILILPSLMIALLPYLTTKDFLSADDYIFPCFVLTASSGIFGLVYTILVFMRRTKTVAIVNGIMLLFNFVSMYISVLKWGAVGAAYALTVTYLLGAIILLSYAYYYREKCST